MTYELRKNIFMLPQFTAAASLSEANVSYRSRVQFLQQNRSTISPQSTLTWSCDGCSEGPYGGFFRVCTFCEITCYGGPVDGYCERKIWSLNLPCNSPA